METLTLDNFITLGMLVLLQAVLGFDNLLYISLESKSAPAEKRSMVRQVGIGLAVILRIALLFILINLIELVQEPVFGINISGYLYADFSWHSVIVLLGGGFILYTAIKEIWHMIALEEHEETVEKKPRSVGSVIGMIVLMNLVFSFDSILSAIALTDVFWVMATAIVIGGLLMIFLADRISDFLQKNRMYEVLGLFILFLVGVMLISEGGELAHMEIFGTKVEHMSKATFYFVLITTLYYVNYDQDNQYKIKCR
ncbi:MAG: TerC family protein, partial [Bacteroidota bacterium]